jgi:hypothetical protein
MTQTCPKCQASMVRGVVLDNTYRWHRVSRWLEGLPKRSIWVGIQLQGKTPIEIVTWRCAKCGFLESYAPDG